MSSNTNSTAVAAAAASIPLQCEPLGGKTIKVGVQLKKDDAPEAAVSAGMLRELIEGRFGKDAALTTEDGTPIPDREIIWARSSDGSITLRPHLHVSSSIASRSNSVPQHQQQQQQQQSSPLAENTPRSEQQEQQKEQDQQREHTNNNNSPLVAQPSVADTITKHQRQLKVAQTLLETDRMRWTQQLEVLRRLRDVSLQILAVQRQTTQQQQSGEPTLEELARRLSEEQQSLDANAPVTDAKRDDVRGAEQLLDTLETQLEDALRSAGVLPQPQPQHESDQHHHLLVKAQYSDAPQFLRNGIFNLALRRVQLEAVQEEMQTQQQMLDALRYQRRAIIEHGEKKHGHVRVVVRQRPYLDFVDGAQPRRLGAPEIGEVTADEHSRLVRVFAPATGPREFEFVRVYGPAPRSATAAQQEQIFDEEVVPLLRDAMSHNTDATVLCFGPTGSGKSFCVFGNHNQHNQHNTAAEAGAAGILEMAVSEIVQFSGDADIQATELYLDQRTDLLLSTNSTTTMSSQQQQQQQQHPHSFGVNDAVSRNNALHNSGSEHTWLRVTTVDAALRAVRRAAARRVTARTLTNDVSSRSHMIVSVRFPNNNGPSSSGVGVTKLTFVDLAGSERVGRSLSTGERLREAQHINKSLSALCDVVAALAAGSSHVPYRNSKLTQMLQQSLGGSSRTLMLLCVPPHLPDQHNMSEIVSALSFGARARGVRNSSRAATTAEEELQ